MASFSRTAMGKHPDLDLRNVGPEPMSLAWIHDRLNDRRLRMNEPLRILLTRGQAADLNIEVRMAGAPTMIEGVEVVVYV